MAEWVLILTYILGNNGRVYFLEGFATRQECQQAGAAWTAMQDGRWSNAKAVCVKRTGKPVVDSNR